MKLWTYLGKHIIVTCINGNVIEGKCDEFTQALDNEPPIASISIAKNGYGIEIYENEIKSIKEI
jgi:hypothetical protein